MTDIATDAAGAPDPLVSMFSAAWAEVATGLATLLQHPVEIQHESLQTLLPDGLKRLLPKDGVATLVAVEAEPPGEMRLWFALDLSIHLAGTLLLTRKEDMDVKLRTLDLNEGDQDAVGEVANIMTSAVDEALRLRTAYQMHLVRKEVARLSSGEGAAALPEGGELAVEVLTMRLPGQGEGKLIWSMPAELTALIVGSPEESPAPPVEGAMAASAETVAETATPAASAAAGPPAAAGNPARPAPAGASGEVAGQALVAGPVAQDNRDIEEALKARGFAVESLPHLKAVPAAVAGTPYDLVVLAAPPLSLAALALLREAAATPGAPPFVVVTRRPTPGYVFQSVRAGARYVAVFPLAEAAADRMVQFAAECRQAA